MGTGGGNVPLVLCYSKQRRAKSKDDFETWIEADVSNTLNAFDVGGSYGNGSEVLVICSIRTPSERYARTITKAQTDNMSNKES